MIEELKDYLSCSEMPVGTKKVVNIDNPDSSPTGVDMHYVLERSEKDKYSIWINPRFGEEFWGAEGSAAEVRKAVKECLPNFNSHLFGPNGEKMTIKLVPENTTDPFFKEIEVGIDTTHKEIRANSRRYSTKSKCGTILHEIMHLLGLPDEYDDDFVQGSRLFKSCRAVGMYDSMMRDPYTEIEDGMSKRRVLQACSCNPRQTNCKDLNEKEISNAKTQMSCPEGYKFIDAFTFSKDDPAQTHQGLTSAEVVSLNSSFVFDEPALFVMPTYKFVILRDSESPRGDSYLYPAHARAILFPHCMKKNRKYYDCSRHSYNRLFWYKNCADVPKYCKNPTSWLM